MHDVGGIGTSVSRFGFNAPPIVDERSGRLVVGHGRIKALRARKVEGKGPPARVEEREGEWYVPVLRGVEFQNADDAEAYLTADNRWTELGGRDDNVLAEVLSDLAAGDGGLEGTGFDGDDLDQLLGDLSGGDQSGDLEARYEIIVQCSSEMQQRGLLDRLEMEGFQCKALMT